MLLYSLSLPLFDDKQYFYLFKTFVLQMVLLVHGCFYYVHSIKYNVYLSFLHFDYIPFSLVLSRIKSIHLSTLTFP